MRNRTMKKKDEHHLKKEKLRTLINSIDSIPCNKISRQETPNSVGEWEDNVL